MILEIVQFGSQYECSLGSVSVKVCWQLGCQLRSLQPVMTPSAQATQVIQKFVMKNTFAIYFAYNYQLQQVWLQVVNLMVTFESVQNITFHCALKPAMCR